MKFPYRTFGLNIFRPVIPVQLSYRNRKTDYNVLIDSGADFSLFDKEIGRMLGIDIEKGEKSQAVGITGNEGSIYIHTIHLSVDGKQFKIRAAFLENMTQTGYGIVGQVGFFDKFEVRFDYQNKEIELIEKKKKPQRSLFWSTLTRKP